jgi:hypothetical protein
MPSEPQIRRALRSWVLAKASGLDAAGLTDQTPLFANRHLRSVHLPELLLLLERLSGVPIEVDDLQPGDFSDIDTLVRRFGQPAPAAAPVGAGPDEQRA